MLLWACGDRPLIRPITELMIAPVMDLGGAGAGYYYLGFPPLSFWAPLWVCRQPFITKPNSVHTVKVTGKAGIFQKKIKL